MSSIRYTPVFTRDLNEYIVPGLTFDTVEEAADEGTRSKLTSPYAGYGFAFTGKTAPLQDDVDGGYVGRFIIVEAGGQTLWMIGGNTLNDLLERNNPAVLTTTAPLSTTDGTPKTVSDNVSATASLAVGGDHTGPDVVNG